MSKSFSSALRPYLHAHVKPRNRDVYLRFYAAATKATSQPAVADEKEGVDSLWSPSSYRKRLKQLTALHPDGQNAPTEHLYPRIGLEKTLSPAQFRHETDKLELKPGDWARKIEYKIQGMVYADYHDIM
jgi:hypothetical protein